MAHMLNGQYAEALAAGETAESPSFRRRKFSKANFSFGGSQTETHNFAKFPCRTLRLDVWAPNMGPYGF